MTETHARIILPQGGNGSTAGKNCKNGVRNEGNAGYIKVGYALQAPLDYLCSKDEVLEGVIIRTGLPGFENTRDVFEDLVSCILDMRIHYAPTAPAFRYPLLKRLIGGRKITPQIVEDLSTKVLSELKLSHQKDETLKAWATKWRKERLDKVDWYALTDGEVFDHLNGIKGVGKWSKQMILLFTLERPDIFPESDYQLSKAMCDAYCLKEDKRLRTQMKEISNQWVPFRSLAVRCLWRWREKLKKGG